MIKEIESPEFEERAQKTGLKLLTVNLRAKCREELGVEGLSEGSYTGCILEFLWFIFLKSREGNVQ